SLVGVVALSLREERLKKILVYLVGFSAGALFGDAFFHLLPEAVGEQGFTLVVSGGVLAGILLFFIVEKVVHWHHCHMPITKEHTHPFALMNLVGDAVHNFLDGVIIGVSYLVGIPVGIATTVAVILHEIPQEISDFGVLLHGGFSKRKALWLNFLTALAAVAGAVLALLVGTSLEGVVSFLVPLAAGGFIYIAGADLIPELHKETETKKSLMQVAIILFGFAVMAGLLLLE
ncbi:TPA: ZIP family metal transporter, partial [Candidatus Woesearchaeota archaeon]|nr:ZIP family metal transporter [Candidatus Woesearchaeota archaeon]